MGHWFCNNQMVAWVSSVFLTLTGFGAMIVKYGPKIRKGERIARHVLDLLDDVQAAAEDGKVDVVEIEKIKADIQALIDDNAK